MLLIRVWSAASCPPPHSSPSSHARPLPSMMLNNSWLAGSVIGLVMGRRAVMRGVAYAHWQCVHMRPKKEECVCWCVCVYVCVHVANVFECVWCMFEFIGVLRSSYCSRPPMSCQILSRPPGPCSSRCELLGLGGIGSQRPPGCGGSALAALPPPGVLWAPELSQ